MLKTKAPQMLNGTVEVDETFIGGAENLNIIAKRKRRSEDMVTEV